MKLFTKIFLCSMTVLTAVLALLGCLMISGSFQNAVERENRSALSQYELLKFVLQTGMMTAGELDDAALSAVSDRTLSAVPASGETAVLSESGGILLSTFPEAYDFGFIDRIGADDVLLRTDGGEDEVRLVAAGKFMRSGRTVTLVIARRVTHILEEKRLMEKNFLTAFLITELVGAAVMAAFSFALTKPINRLTRSTRLFAGGRLAERTDVRGNDEISELSQSFNSMAGTIEETIKKLELSAKQKDDFTASFAHELKTPLTSVIGYADMIYQRNGLTREEVKEAAGFIVNEGMRLEALSLKLMELIVLDKHEFTLMEMNAREVLADIAGTMKPVLNRKRAELSVEAEEAYIMIEFDLFKTLVMNLIDNAAKADAAHIMLSGRLENGSYAISVSDDGRGIPADQLERITEAFYMVDKSRSRREHGAGLGLAIASRIADIHGTKLVFSSVLGEGTTVSFALPAVKEEPCE